MAGWGNAVVTAALGPVIAGVAGGVIGAFGSGNKRASRGIISFATGAFLALALLHLVPESASVIGWAPALAAAVCGYGVALLVARKASGFCPVCALTGEHEAEATSGPGLGAPLLVVVAAHSSLDGLALSGAAQHGHTAELMSLALLLHKLPEGMAVAAVLRAQGQSVVSAIVITALLEALTLAGAYFGATLLARESWLLAALTGAVGGSFIYLAGLALTSLVRRRGTAVLLAAAGAALVVLGHVLYG